METSFSKKSILLKSSISLDAFDIRYVCFFLVLISSSVCTICGQSDLSLDVAKMSLSSKLETSLCQ